MTAAQRDLKTAEDQLDTAVEVYARLMGIPPSQVTGFELPEDLSPSIVQELGNKTSAQLRDRAAVDVGEANRATGFWNQVPDPTFGISKDFYSILAASPTGASTDYNYFISITIPILFPLHEMAEAQRSENQGVVSREMSRFNLVQDNSAQEAGVKDYRRSKARYLQLHSRDLILAETMMEAAVAAYKRGQFEFTALMLAHQTYAAAKEEDIQIRAEIVNARLTGLVGDEEPVWGGKTDYSSNLPNIDTYLSSASYGTSKSALPAPVEETPTAVATPPHFLGTNNPPVAPPPLEPTAAPTPAEVGAADTPSAGKDQTDSNETIQTTPSPQPTAGTDEGKSSKEPN